MDHAPVTVDLIVGHGAHHRAAAEQGRGYYRQRGEAGAVRAVANSLGRETEQDEIAAWVCEIDTWTALVGQDWSRAAELAAAGEAIATFSST